MAVGPALGATRPGQRPKLSAGRRHQQHFAGHDQPNHRHLHPLAAHRHLHLGVRATRAVSRASLVEHLVRLCAGAGVLRPLLLLVSPRQPRGGLVLGGPRGAPPKPPLQPLDGAAPVHFWCAAGLDFLHPDGAGRCAAAGVWHRRAHRLALSVLGAHRACGPLGLV